MTSEQWTKLNFALSELSETDQANVIEFAEDLVLHRMQQAQQGEVTND